MAGPESSARMTPVPEPYSVSQDEHFRNKIAADFTKTLLGCEWWLERMDKYSNDMEKSINDLLSVAAVELADALIGKLAKENTAQG